MTIYFNTEWDRAPWSDQSAALGVIQAGPQRLLTILETRCGTSGIRQSGSARVAGMMSVLTEILADTPSETQDSPYEWFRSSFESDPWAVAAELLSFRDELLTARVAAGHSEPSDPAEPTDQSAQPLQRRRLQALTVLMDHPEVPGGGFPDRIMDVLGELRSPDFVRLGLLSDYRIVVEEPEPFLPPMWRTVFDAISAAGGVVEYRADSGASPNVPASSPVLTVVNATDQWQAAEHIAAFLSQLEGSGPTTAGQVALVVSGDASALDSTLQRWSLPVTGRNDESASRWGLQILPAFLSTLWRPADPRAIASFLSLATGLVPRVVSRQIIRAVSEHPGTGGEKWTEALEAIGTALDAKFADFYNSIFAAELFDPHDGVPAGVLDERLRWLTRGLASGVDQRDTLSVALGHVAELREAIQRLNGSETYRVSRALLERIVDTVVRPISAGVGEQAALWSVHNSLATVPTLVDTVVIWNGASSESAVAQRFTDAERESLIEAGYLLESPDAVRSRQEWNRSRALSVPQRHVIVCVPQYIRGSKVEPAPWIAELMMTLGDSVNKVDLAGSDAVIEIAGISVPRHQPLAPDADEPRSTHHVPPGAVALPEKLSYSSIQGLIGCSMQWALSRTDALSSASNVSLPTGNQMMGTLTHAIVERIAREYAPSGVFPEDVGRIAASLFEEMIPAMAAELLQPGQSLTRRRYREVVVSAVAALGTVIRDLDLTVARVETFLEAPLELSIGDSGETTTVLFRGPADMELKDERGNPFVLDLKYSHADNYYTELVSNGKSLQLASYAWLIEQDTGRQAVGSGYFLLPQQRLITDSARAGAEAIESARSLGEIWRRGEQSTSRALELLHTDGVLDVTGLQEREEDGAAEVRKQTMEEAGGLYVKPPCAFCDFQVICGYGRGQM
jgi:ATP-dependent helicase/nuclease subunit B